MVCHISKLLPLLYLLAWAAMGGARSARAERVTILVYPEAGQPEPSDRIRSVMSEVLAGAEMEEIDAFAEAKAALLAGARPAEELQAFTRAKQLMEEGWRSYLEVRASFASARLAAARTAVLDVAALAGGQQLLAEVSLRLGVAKLALGREAEAADDFRLAFALRPERAVDDAEFRPDVVAAFQVAIAEERQRQARPVVLTPATAQLWIDGSLDKGTSVELSDGLHLVYAKAEGYRTQSKLISVSPGADAPIEISLAVDPVAATILRGRPALATGVAEVEARQAVSAVMLFAASDKLVLTASVWRRGQPALLGQICSGQPAKCSAVIEIGYPIGGLHVAAEKLWRTLAREKRRFPPTLQVDARLIAGEKAPGVNHHKVSTPLWKKRWLWLGVAGASLAAGAWLLLDGQVEVTPVFGGERCDFGAC